jgi:hypothetical protein
MPYVYTAVKGTAVTNSQHNLCWSEAIEYAEAGYVWCQTLRKCKELCFCPALKQQWQEFSSTPIPEALASLHEPFVHSSAIEIEQGVWFANEMQPTSTPAAPELPATAAEHAAYETSTTITMEFNVVSFVMFCFTSGPASLENIVTEFSLGTCCKLLP